MPKTESETIANVIDAMEMTGDNMCGLNLLPVSGCHQPFSANSALTSIRFHYMPLKNSRPREHG
jgi:hypothetical protein